MRIFLYSCGVLFMHTEKTIDCIKDYIYGYDLSNVLSTLILREGWMKADADETATQYRDFLFLVKKYGPMEPSQDVDEFWHQHILMSSDYWIMTHEVYGCYLHHAPHAIEKQQANKKSSSNIIPFEKSLQIYRSEFNKELYATKSKYPKILYPLLKKLMRQ